MLDAEASENMETPVNCFRKLFGDLNRSGFAPFPLLKLKSLPLIVFFILSVCDVLPLVLKNMDMRLPNSLIQKYMLKAAEFYIGYVTRGPSPDVQIHGKVTAS